MKKLYIDLASGEVSVAKVLLICLVCGIGAFTIGMIHANHEHNVSPARTPMLDNGCIPEQNLNRVGREKCQ